LRKLSPSAALHGLPRDLLFDTLAKTAVVSPVQVGKLATARSGTIIRLSFQFA
jgi:hypothetical protein